MSCQAINEQLLKESGRIAIDIFKETYARTPWLGLINQGTWPAGMGDIINTPIFGRSLASVLPLSWEPIASGSDTCLPPVSSIDQAQTLLPFQLQRYALQSDFFCLDKLRNDFDVRAQLGMVVATLADNTAWAWRNQYRAQYTNVASHKVIATPGFPEASAAFPLVEPTLVINQGLLDYYRRLMLQDGAGNRGVMAMMDGQAAFGLILSQEQSDFLLRGDQNFRQDVRWAAPSELLKALGASFPRRGFVHLVDIQPPRWNFVGGAWVQVPEYIGQATTNGTRLVLNPAYQTAQFEDTFIFHESVYKSLVPQPESFGPVSFNPQNYRGTFKWLNYQTAQNPNPTVGEYCNPDLTIGYFRGLFYMAPQAIYPQYGTVIRSQRCEAEPLGVTCVYGT